MYTTFALYCYDILFLDSDKKRGGQVGVPAPIKGMLTLITMYQRRFLSLLMGISCH